MNQILFRKYHCILLLSLTSCFSSVKLAIANPDELPVLGDSVSSVVSHHQEHVVGKSWLRSLRAQAPISGDPLLNDYTEHLIYNLAANSELQDKRLSPIIINSPAINAFAVPGGIIGVNAGLFLNAETEDELAGVLAHEIAHLSQRHFARSVEEAQKNQLTQSAALLASILVIATAGGDAGLAALATTQAAAVQAQLHFTRRNEQEADRIGIRTLIKAEKDPEAMSRFFERLQKSTQFLGHKPPEYLLTHPVTESRIADSRNRATQYPVKHFPDNLEFHLMKARIQVHYNQNLNHLIKQFQSKLDGETTFNQISNRYGLTLALVKAKRFKEAAAAIKPLIEKEPERIAYVLAKANISAESGHYGRAEKLLRSHYKHNPNNYPLTLYYADTLTKNGKAKKAAKILQQYTIARPEDPYVWALLSVAQGKSKNIIGVHQARAEYIYLQGDTKHAIQQLEFALEIVVDDFPLSSKIKGRIDQLNRKNTNFKF